MNVRIVVGRGEKACSVTLDSYVLGRKKKCEDNRWGEQEKQNKIKQQCWYVPARYVRTIRGAGTIRTRVTILCRDALS